SEARSAAGTAWRRADADESSSVWEAHRGRNREVGEGRKVLGREAGLIYEKPGSIFYIPSGSANSSRRRHLSVIGAASRRSPARKSRDTSPMRRSRGW